MYRRSHFRAVILVLVVGVVLGGTIACGSASSEPSITSALDSTTITTSTTVPVTSTEPPAASAQYELVFEATWSEETHPTDFPPNPHFSGLIGAGHGPGVYLWQEGEPATPGMKNMAETGGKSPLDTEVEALISSGDACVLISGSEINPAPGTATVTFELTQDCSLVSVASMIAPSPDWFVGVSRLDLFEGGQWATEVVVELFPYDGGTDSGSSYASANKPTGTPEGIYRIEAAPFTVGDDVPPLGTFTFTRVDI